MNFRANNIVEPAVYSVISHTRWVTPVTATITTTTTT